MRTWTTSPLGEDHEVEHFDCGQPSLNDWLRQQAARAQQQGTARTYVWTPPHRVTVVAYFSVAPSQVSREDITRGLSGGVSAVPGYLLARLALDRDLHGHGLGGQLLLNALETLVEAAEIGGGRLIVVDPIDAAASAFYLHYDFTPIAGHTRLYVKFATARATLAQGSDQPP